MLQLCSLNLYHQSRNLIFFNKLPSSLSYSFSFFLWLYLLYLWTKKKSIAIGPSIFEASKNIFSFVECLSFIPQMKASTGSCSLVNCMIIYSGLHRWGANLEQAKTNKCEGGRVKNQQFWRTFWMTLNPAYQF